MDINANPSDNFTGLLQRKAQRSLTILQQRASVVNGKLSAIDLIIKDASRTRRAIIDGGGKLLEWLFGTATDERLNKINDKVGRVSTHQKEITHLLAEQATVLNETLWESRAELELINRVNDKNNALNLRLLDLAHYAHDQEAVENGRWVAWALLEEGLESAKTTLLWLEGLVVDLNLSLEALAAGKLPPQLLAPSRLENALEDLTRQLPKGWEMVTSSRSGRAWSVYHDAQVFTARYDGKLRIFAQIPIQNRMFQYHLLRVFAMPFILNSSNLMIVNGLPRVLAVASDLQTFIELTEMDVKGCFTQSQSNCTIHAGILKKNRPSCAFALHQKDTRSADEWCTTRTTTEKGLTAAYLGERTWALSTFTEQKLVTS